MGEVWPVVVFIAAFTSVIVLTFGFVVFFFIRLGRPGKLTEVLLGGRVVRALDELPTWSRRPRVKARVRVHAVATDEGPAVGVLVTHSGPGFWQRVGFTLTPEQQQTFLAQLTEAAAADEPQ